MFLNFFLLLLSVCRFYLKLTFARFAFLHSVYNASRERNDDLTHLMHAKLGSGSNVLCYVICIALHGWESAFYVSSLCSFSQHGEESLGWNSKGNEYPRMRYFLSDLVDEQKFCVECNSLFLALIISCLLARSLVCWLSMYLYFRSENNKEEKHQHLNPYGSLCHQNHKVPFVCTRTQIKIVFNLYFFFSLYLLPSRVRTLARALASLDFILHCFFFSSFESPRLKQI